MTAPRCEAESAVGPMTVALSSQYMARFSELLDLNRMYCNDLHSMASFYGIEAASKAIVKVSEEGGLGFGEALESVQRSTRNFFEGKNVAWRQIIFVDVQN